MLTLQGGTQFLLLNRAKTSSKRCIFAFSHFKAAITHWQHDSRISPIFSLDKAPVPDFSSTKKTYLFFMGPVFPGDIDITPFTSAYLTLGLFNFVLICANKKMANAAQKVADGHKVQWEQWEIKKNKIENIKSSYFISKSTSLPDTLLKPFTGLDQSLAATAREYIVLTASSIANAQKYQPFEAQGLIGFDKVFRTEYIQSDLFETSYKHGLLVNVNAVLSRHMSQAYSGTSPILEKTCHIWTHSLLGIGVASLALTKTIYFLESLLDKVDLVGRIKHFEKEKSVSSDFLEFTNLPENDSLLRKDYLCSKHENLSNMNTPENEGSIPSMLCCYSGRDGFKSTKFTLSAPLEIVNSCNTRAWTPLTLTHEISHSEISRILGLLIPTTNQCLQETVSMLNGQKTPSLFKLVRTYLCFGIWNMDGERSENVDSHRLNNLIREHFSELNEIITHCFDFLYFYRKEGEDYVRSIWTSWDVIPNIRDRIPEYITRSLCALHTTNIDRTNGCKTSIKQLKVFLSSIARQFPETKYVNEAIEAIKNPECDYISRLQDREIIVKFVRFFLYSPKIAKLFAQESLLTKGRGKKSYTLKPGKFSSTRVQNPMRFVETYANDLNINNVRSAWILQHLAFMGK